VPGPSQISCPFFPTGFFGAGFFLATLARLHIALNIIITFVVVMFIIKVGYGVTPRPYPIFSRICWLFSFRCSINFW